MIWTRTKINYVFVFEFDTRSALDWRQLAEVLAVSLLSTYLTLAVTFSVLLSPGPVHVAQFYVDQCHVYLLASRAHFRDSRRHVPPVSSALPPKPKMVGIFECESQPRLPAAF